MSEFVREPIKGECILRLTKEECISLVAILKIHNLHTNVRYLNSTLASERESFIKKLIDTLECFT